MAGEIFSSDKLNSALLEIVKILLENKLYYWFIGYGTLLGIVRNESCINNDDDIDIIFDIKYKDKLLEVLEKKNYKIIMNIYSKTLEPTTNIFIKVGKDNQPTIDFYFAISNNDVYHDLWENIYWGESTPFVIKPWKNTILLLPKNAESKLKTIYGDDWKTPRKRGEYIECTSRNINNIK